MSDSDDEGNCEDDLNINDRFVAVKISGEHSQVNSLGVDRGGRTVDASSATGFRCGRVI